MNIWQTNALNYATVDVDGHLYDVHFRYYGGDSYYVESVYEMAAKEAQFNVIHDLDAVFIRQLVAEIDAMSSLKKEE